MGETLKKIFEWPVTLSCARAELFIAYKNVQLNLEGIIVLYSNKSPDAREMEEKQ